MPLDHALAYAARGWRVVPIPPGAKYPAHPKWQDIATTDAARIIAWWTAHPDDGIGIVTGPESGIFIVDIDPRDGGDDSLRVLEAKYGPLPDTVESITGSQGRHIVFRWPAEGEVRNSASGRLGVGIDVRGVGGQFVAPPSLHKSGNRYAWEVMHDPFDGVAVAEAPEWLLDVLTKQPTPRAPRREVGAITLGDPKPGDHFETTHTWPELLEPDGWTLHSNHATSDGHEYEMWTRPGKDPSEGASASLYYMGSDVLKVFTSSVAGLEPEATYTRFGYYAARNHNGDHVAAARALRGGMTESTVEQGGERMEQLREPPPPLPPDAAPVEPADEGKPAIVVGRQLSDLKRDALLALEAWNRPPTRFVRGGQLAWIRDDEDKRPIVEPLKLSHVRDSLSEAATWWRASTKGHNAVSPPNDVCESVLVAGRWPLPALAGVVELPVIRPDGTFVVDHGYDSATRLYHWHRGRSYAPISPTPTPAELRAAVETIAEVLIDFAWDTEADKANAWGLMLTPLVRPLIRHGVPMALIDAPEPGTGKGLLVTVIASLALGRPAGLRDWPSTEEEMGKTITTTLMEGSTMIIYDNVEGMVRSGSLAAALTADVWTGRILGMSKSVTVQNRATWVATGNNIDVGGDLARRCYRIRLDARQARPYERTGFRRSYAELTRYVIEQRTELLHALCTVVRSWWVAGAPQANGIAAMGGYTEWVRTVGGILAHAGVSGFLDNLVAFQKSADREAQAWESFLSAWRDQFADEVVTVGQLVARMKDLYGGSALRDALPDELQGDMEHGRLAQRLGHALRKRSGRHYGDLGMHVVEQPRDRRGVALYSVALRAAGSAGSRDVAPEPISSAPLPHIPRVSPQPTADSAGSAGSIELSTQSEKETIHMDVGAKSSRTSQHPAATEFDAADLWGRS